MKYLVVALVLLLVGWLMLRGRSRPDRPPRGKPGPQPMLVCEHCGIHLPRDEAVQDANGDFCSEAHRLAGPRHR